MEKITFTIQTTNDAFVEDEGKEVARILRELANKFEGGGEPSVIYDLNGARVGSIIID